LTEVRPDGSLGPNVSLEGEPESGGAAPVSLKSSAEFVADAYGATLVALGARHPELVVLDADLAADCRVRQFELTYPDRFIECGIAEQDMVSMAGGLARQGLLPVVNSFACFLVSRANEQIYNNASERSRIVYASHYAGMIPAGPGKSHQSIRDIGLLGALPNMTIVQPCNARETEALLTWAVETAADNVAIRLIIGPSPRRIEYPADWRLEEGRGTALTAGRDAVVLAYGPVMLHETLLAAETLASRGIGVQVIAMPWLNRFDGDWLKTALAPFRHVFVVEDHAPAGGLGDALLRHLAGAGRLGQHDIHVCGVEGYPACGTPPEALKAQGLDAASLAQRIAHTR
jgi:transketolase